MTKTVTDDALLAVKMREEAEDEKYDGYYTSCGELLRAGADAIERLQNTLEAAEQHVKILREQVAAFEPSALPFITPDEVRAEALRPMPMRIETADESLRLALERKARKNICEKCGQNPYDGHDMCTRPALNRTGDV
jgi:hypothetical protein